MCVMSIKRSREYSRRPTPDYKEPGAVKKGAGRRHSFDRDVASRPADTAVAYEATYRYAEDALIEHAIFGRGLVTRVEGARIEVLFKEGIKKLAHDPSGPTPPMAAPSGGGPQLAVPGSEPSDT